MKSQNNFPTLPEGWEIATVGYLATKVQYGTSAKANEDSIGIPIIRMGNIINGSLICETLKYLPHTHDEFPDLLLEEGDVLFNRTNSAELVGKTAVYKGFPKPCSFASYLIRVQLVNEYHPDLLAYYINSVFGRKWISTVVSQQVGQANVNGTKLQALSVPVPPLAEQHRIVAKIEELFTKLDAGVASLKAAKAQLKRYRQSVLKAAVEGELTREWREQHQDELEPASVLLERILRERRAKWEADQLAKMQAQGKSPKDDKWKEKYQEPDLPETDGLPSIPTSWQWCRLDALAEIKQGLSKDGNRQVADGRIVPYLRVANVQRMYLDLREVKLIEASEAVIHELRLKRYDLLFTEGGDRDKLGRGWIWQDEIDECIHQNHIFRARLFSVDIAPKIISWFSNSYGQKYFLREGKQTTNLASINLTKLSAFPIPLPPFQEQTILVGEVERHLSIADEIEATLDAELKRSEHLRQSILKRAFEGKLVPQDPNDEPASVLLERIKAENSKKVSQSSNGKRTTRKRRSPAAADEPTLPLE